MANKLVFNGCSYMVSHMTGYSDLANRLGVPLSESIARSGSCNNRIIRTTIKHSYQTTDKCLYIVGLTFPTREERPIGRIDHEFEGRWLNIQNGFLDTDFDEQWTQEDCDLYMRLKTKILMTNNLVDIVEDLMYRVTSMIADLRNRGHNVVVFQQVDNGSEYWKDNVRLSLLKGNPHIVDGLSWFAIPWQIAQGAKTNDYGSDVPVNVRHIAVGEHKYLNEFLEQYIKSTNVHL